MLGVNIDFLKMLLHQVEAVKILLHKQLVCLVIDHHLDRRQVEFLSARRDFVLEVAWHGD